MKLPVLYFDNQCPLCRSFSKKIERKTKGRLNLIATENQNSELRYERSSDLKDQFEGLKATENLILDFPELKELMWLLPSNLRKDAMLTGYKWSNKIRSLLFKKKCKVCPKK